MWSCVLGFFSSKRTTYEHLISITRKPRLLKTSTRGSLTKRCPQALLWWRGWNCCGCADWKLCQILTCLESRKAAWKTSLDKSNHFFFFPWIFLGRLKTAWRIGYPYTEINTHIQTLMHTDEHSNADVIYRHYQLLNTYSLGDPIYNFTYIYLIFFCPQQQNMDDINAFFTQRKLKQRVRNNLSRVSKLQRNRIFLYDCA